MSGSEAVLRHARRCARLLAVAALALFAAGTANAQVFSGQSCAADRAKNNLNCTANDIEIADIQVLSGPSTCVIGDPVTLTLDIGLHVNAQNMHDVGIFLSQDGKSPIIRSTAGGSASCGVAGIPMSPPPFANIDTAFPQNQCGDFDRDGFAQGYVARAPLGAVTLTCSPDLATGKAAIPAVVTWDPSQESSCSVPASLGAATGSKCEAKVVPVNVAVQGKIAIVKTTSPPTPGSFPFSATGPAGFTTQNFTLSHGGSFTFPRSPSRNRRSRTR